MSLSADQREAIARAAYSSLEGNLPEGAEYWIADAVLALVDGWLGEARRDEREQAEKRHEREMMEVLEDRDDLHDWADKLAAALAPADVLGEHSNMNNPWQNALDNGNYVTIAERARRDEQERIKEDTYALWAKSRRPGLSDMLGVIGDG